MNRRASLLPYGGCRTDEPVRMSRAQEFLLLLVAVAACSSTEGTLASPPGPGSWPIGIYALEARIEYHDDNTYGPNTVREDHHADLIIPPGSSPALRNPNGVCRDLTRQEVERDEAFRRKTFICGDFTYVVERAGSTIRGELTVTVNERIRRRGACIQYRSVVAAGVRQCVEYRWYVNSRRTRKQARLTVIPGT